MLLSVPHLPVNPNSQQGFRKAVCPSPFNPLGLRLHTPRAQTKPLLQGKFSKAQLLVDASEKHHPLARHGREFGVGSASTGGGQGQGQDRGKDRDRTGMGQGQDKDRTGTGTGTQEHQDNGHRLIHYNVIHCTSQITLKIRIML